MLPEPPDPALIGHIEAMHQRQHATVIGLRTNLRRFDAVVCSCRKWFTWDTTEPPQTHCPVHAVLMDDEKGGWL
jgi:hypothetical protein